MALRRRQLKIALVTGVGIAAVCVTLRFMWWATPMTPGQYQMGYFEEPNGVASLVLDDAQHTSIQPDVGLDASGALSLPPGRSVGLPLEDGIEYRVRVEDERWAPFCVFGQKEPVAEQESRHGGFRLADARTLVSRDGQLTESDWAVIRPWRDERHTLENLRQQCAAADEAPLVVQVQDGRTDIRYGACALRLAGAARTMGVLAGPAWTSVEKRPNWRTGTRLQPGALLFAAGFGALESAIASIAIGTMATGVFAGALFVLACLLPQTALVGLVAAVPLSFAVAGIRTIRIARRAQSRLRLALGILLVSVPAVIALLPFVAAQWPSGENASHTPQQCLLVGYSTMRGDSLRQDAHRGPWVEHGGLWDDVQQCGACDGSFERRALAAGRFSWVRDVLCGGGRSVKPGGQVIFFGGSNDDFVSARFRVTQLAQAVRLARYAYARPDVPGFHRLAASAEADSLAALPSQADALHKALACIARDGARFRYVHDFFAWDLAQPRSEARQRMLDARAEMVRRAGGDFVDLLHEFVDEAGVWWFNDYVHPSEIAQRRIGASICRELDGR